MAAYDSFKRGPKQRAAQTMGAEFTLFYLEAFPRVAAFARRMTSSRDDAFELTQEAFVRTWAAWARVREADDQVQYVLKVVANVALTRGRRASVLKNLLGLLGRPEPGSDRTKEIDQRLAVGKAVASLPRRERTVVALFYLADLPSDDVARIMGISPSTVRVHLTNARQRLAPMVELAEPQERGDVTWP
jgi:RNA polymerase sigma factor (sigma-70 family)